MKIQLKCAMDIQMEMEIAIEMKILHMPLCAARLLIYLFFLFFSPLFFYEFSWSDHVKSDSMCA